MKKIIIVLLLTFTVILGGCISKGNKGSSDASDGSGKAIISNNSVEGKYTFDNSDCQTYVTLMECLIDKTPDSAKDQTINSFEKVMQLWKSLDKETLPSTCKNTMDMLKNQKEVFAKAGCELK